MKCTLKRKMARCLHWCLAMLAIVTGAGMLTACDEDVEPAMALSGQWQGDFGMYYVYVDGWGREYVFDSYDTDIVFYPDYDYATHGTGKQVDYYQWGPYEYQYYQFNWRIRDGIVYLTYPYDHDLDVCIMEYHLTNNTFTGVFAGTGSSFRLRKLVDFYDWTPYVNSWGYHDRNNWSTPYGTPYYVKGEKAAQEGYILRRGNRMNEKR